MISKAPDNLSDQEKAAWYQQDPTAFNVTVPFSALGVPANGLMWDSIDRPCYPYDEEFPCSLYSFAEPMAFVSHEFAEGDQDRITCTDFIYVQSGSITVRRRGNTFDLVAGMYAAISDSYTFSGDGRGIVVTRYNYKGMFTIGGPVEDVGRLKYIDGCTDSLLIPPVKKGDPCFNFLHFPPGIDQTMHTHPSVRVGMVARGVGTCVTPNGEYDLFPGLVFVIHTEGLHKFRTGEHSMDVIAFHPDSDFGPTDEEHPMLNRTIVDGVSAKLISSIRTQ